MSEESFGWIRVSKQRPTEDDATNGQVLVATPMFVVMETCPWQEARRWDWWCKIPSTLKKTDE